MWREFFCNALVVFLLRLHFLVTGTGDQSKLLRESPLLVWSDLLPCSALHSDRGIYGCESVGGGEKVSVIRNHSDDSNTVEVNCSWALCTLETWTACKVWARKGIGIWLMSCFHLLGIVIEFAVRVLTIILHPSLKGIFYHSTLVLILSIIVGR